MTWIWATLLLILAAPFVLWPMVRASAERAAGPDAGDGERAGGDTGPAPPAAPRDG